MLVAVVDANPTFTSTCGSAVEVYHAALGLAMHGEVEWVSYTTTWEPTNFYARSEPLLTTAKYKICHSCHSTDV